MKNPAAVLALICIFSATLAFAAPETRPAPTSRPAPPDPPKREEILIVPLHVHVLTAAGRPDIDCGLKDDDLTRILGKVNKVWRQAGVQFLIERPTRETAENIDAFDQQKAKIEAGALGHYRILAPAKTRELPGIHVYYVHELPPNGVYLGANICFIKETASLRKVPGGIDEPLPRVTSHEIGHALGLPHRQDLTNLMASGTTGTLFNEAELKISRAKAALMNGAMTLPQAQREAKEREKQGDKTSADLLNKLLEAL